MSSLPVLQHQAIPASTRSPSRRASADMLDRSDVKMSSAITPVTLADYPCHPLYEPLLSFGKRGNLDMVGEKGYGERGKRD